MKWKNFIEQFSQNNSNVKPNPPATEQQIAEVEDKLNIQLPNDLKELLKEFNGDNWLVFSTDQIIETNVSCRTAYDLYMPLDCLLFIAGNGCGDYYGYPITREGIKDWEIFIWEHEYDNRIWKANGLEDMITKYYNSEI